jgi:hypothetical protein
MCAIFTVKEEAKLIHRRQSHLLAKRMLHEDYDCNDLVKNFQGLGAKTK